MAKAVKVVGDMNSAELDELKRSYHGLMLVLERLCAEVVATDVTQAQAFQILGSVLASGKDDLVVAGSHVPTGRRVVGVRATPLHPQRPREQVLQDMSADSNF